MKIIDLTQTITNKMLVYPGDVPPILNQTHIIRDDGYTNFELVIGMHIGTHVDGPFHMLENSITIDKVPIQQFIGKACIIDIQYEKEFSNIQLISNIPEECEMLLFHTGRNVLFGKKEYYSDYPVISNEVAKCITQRKIKLIGFDSFSPDIAPYEVHKILFSKGVLIAENLTNLHLLLNEALFEIIALPLKIATDSAPARIVAIVKS